MKISQLKYFQAVCRHMSFTKASEELYVSQPAVSAAVRDLEDEFGIKLFNRQNSNLSLTNEGKWLLEKCESFLKEFDGIETQLQKFSHQRNYLRVGIAPMIGNYYFFALVNDFIKKHPSAKTEIVEAGSLKLREEVVSNTVDVGTVILNDLKSDKFNILKLYDSELVFCVAKGHPHAKKMNISFSELGREKLILLKEDSYQNMLIRSKFKESNCELNVFMFSNQLSSIKKMIYQGECGSFLFKELVDEDSNLVAISLEQPILLEIGLIWLKNQKLYPDMQSFITFVRRNS